MNKYIALVLAVLFAACSQPSGAPTPAPSPPLADVAAKVTPLSANRDRLNALRTAPPAAPPPPDPRTPAQLAAAACTGPGAHCAGTGISHLMLASNQQPIIPPSWTIPNWYIDPSNSATCASDSNSGTSATCAGGCVGATCPSGNGPLLTFAEMAEHRWGTYAPRIRQITTLTFLSSQTTNADPVYLYPKMEASTPIYFVVQGVLTAAQQVATGTLAGTVARNRSTPQLQQETLAGGLAAGQFLVVTGHPGAAWLYKNPSGNNWTLTQPLTLHSIPDGVAAPTEVTTFANLDPYTVYAPVNVQLVEFDPSISTVGGFYPNGFIYHMNVWSTGGLAGFGNAMIGSGVGMYESSALNVGLTRKGRCNFTVTDGLSNSYSGELTSAVNTCPIETTEFYGGALVGSDVAIGEGALGVLLDGDVVVNCAVNAVSSVQIGTLYIDTFGNGSLDLFGANTVSNTGTTILWGPGIINAQGRLIYPAGAGAGAATFPSGSGGINVNGQTKACIGQPGAGTIGACNTAAATGANLDTVLGATSGCLGTFGGGAFCNYGTAW